ncbi:MAG: hypothetical protein AMXMBFR13_24730 [Phycisphaerae bacterium]
MRRRFLTFMLGTLLFTVPAWGQSYELPQGGKPVEKSVAKEWLIGSIFLVGCLVVAFKPAKRSNLQ